MSVYLQALWFGLFKESFAYQYSGLDDKLNVIIWKCQVFKSEFKQEQKMGFLTWKTYSDLVLVSGDLWSISVFNAFHELSALGHSGFLAERVIYP